MNHILNNYITKQVFQSAWNVAQISAIPKVNEVKTNNDLRPISILPVLSKVYERIVLKQMVNFPTDAVSSVLRDSVSAYRKGHLTQLPL